ncbi:DUF2927 domain-containing protein [Albimonas sp. CAU 1670]|uniref:DUF2927 domain-containing protein n=1 Tax=Albimonas sp. CAU 1670 TaxID=3032599 RepID=UPI0023DBDCC1|nr:DUF2927 domain-containing protein [Albimonas sp. CAU 1670]MDF2233058.1 DUF2927 domain-containing protein [Albimonas sp. CAU 1670]
MFRPPLLAALLSALCLATSPPAAAQTAGGAQTETPAQAPAGAPDAVEESATSESVPGEAPSAPDRPAIRLPGGETLDPAILRQLALDIGFGREMFQLPGDAAHWSDARLRRFRRGGVPVEVYSDDPDFATNPAFWGPFKLLAEKLPALTGLTLIPRSRIELWDGPPGLMIFVGKRLWLKDSLVGLARLAGADEEMAARRFDRLALPFLMRGRPVCFAEVRFRAEDSAELALSVVALEISPHLSECVYEEVIQALGPINDSRTVAQTMFNDDGVETIPTTYDWLALSILYDPRLKTGMTREEAAPEIDAILDGLMR